LKMKNDLEYLSDLDFITISNVLPKTQILSGL
jgi:hypothetical protein